MKPDAILSPASRNARHGLSPARFAMRAQYRWGVTELQRCMRFSNSR